MTKSLPKLLLTSLLGALALAGAACEGPATTAQTADPPPKQEPATLEVGEALSVFILPAPSEIASLLDDEQIRTQLGGSRPEPLPDYTQLDPWRRALSLGRVMADLLIAAPGASNDEVASYLDSVARGLESLDAPAGRVQEVRELQARVAGGALSRQELLESFDLLRLEILRDGREQIGEREMTLVAVGGWARAVNLVATVAQATGEVPPGADMLKLRAVVSYLAAEVDDDEQLRPVSEALAAILPVTAHRPTQPSPEELAILEQETGEILALTRVSARQGARS